MWPNAATLCWILITTLQYTTTANVGPTHALTLVCNMELGFFSLGVSFFLLSHKHTHTYAKHTNKEHFLWQQCQRTICCRLRCSHVKIKVWGGIIHIMPEMLRAIFPSRLLLLLSLYCRWGLGKRLIMSRNPNCRSVTIILGSGDTWFKGKSTQPTITSRVFWFQSKFLAIILLQNPMHIRTISQVVSISCCLFVRCPITTGMSEGAAALLLDVPSPCDHQFILSSCHMNPTVFMVLNCKLEPQNRPEIVLVSWWVFGIFINVLDSCSFRCFLPTRPIIST